MPDLVISDLMMPGIDGLELVKRLRADKRTQHIPIIMLTARSELDDRVAGLETGVNAYLAKPFSPRELLTTTRSLLDIQEQTADILLTQRMDSLETIAGGLAHEINNPLNYIKNSLGFIKWDIDKVKKLLAVTPERSLTSAEIGELNKLEDRIIQMFDTAEAGLRRIAVTVDTLRSYSREGYARAVRDVIGLVKPAIGRDIKISTNLVGDGLIDCVPEELNQILTNLVQNAIEAAPEGNGKVEVGGEIEGDELILTVKDNGPGMTQAVRERVFTPFFTTKGPGKGSGMGLAITWRVIESLNGTISVISQPGEGAEFIVRLPVHQPNNHNSSNHNSRSYPTAH